MASSPQVLQRPQRWDASFDPEMTPEQLARILSISPFRDINPESFPKRLPLSEILEHDTRIRRYRPGEIVVRAGDHGTSAFMVISGKVRVVVTPELPASVLGRREPSRKGFFRVLAQLWSNAREPESFKLSQLTPDARVGASVGQGEVKVFLQDVPRLLDEHRTALIEEGEFFGEIAALSRMPRTATIFAEDSAELVEIRWQGLRDLMRYDEKLRSHIDQIYRERALATHLREIPIFQHLSEADLNKVMEKTEFATYGDYDWSGDYKRLAKTGSAQPAAEPIISREGDYPNGIVLVRAGFARLSQHFGNGDRTLNYLGSGQHYGFREIAHNWRHPDATLPLQHTLRAIGYAHLLIVPTSIMEALVLPTLPKSKLPPLVTVQEETAPASVVKEAGADISPDLLEFLTENRFFNGTATMAIDLDRCTRCDDCVRACASTHNNNPRFLRHGPIHEKVMIANACMHCADPVCMIGCPTGAIHRDSFGGQVVINPVTCIGCKACFNNCPYDAIRMVEIRDPDGNILIDQESKPVLKATKCDLCVEQLSGPACQRACPHGALQRLDMGDLTAFAKWVQR